LGGEGTRLAMTEAYVMAGELQRADGDYHRSFEVYESRLRPFVEGKQKKPRAGSFPFSPRGPGWASGYVIRPCAQ
jgi:2-polyprenyl-6-methoxyphenol hydroxylase-like FAD-dependent oxidoreductase